MTETLGVFLVKYWIFVAKTFVALLALVAGPGLSAQAGHGDAHATPAHGSSHDSHATPAANASPTPTPAHSEPAHAAPAAHGEATPATHGEPASADAVHGDEGHGDAGAHGAADSHGGGHGDAHGEHHDVAWSGEKLWFGIPSGWWHFINFVILFGAIGFAVRKGLAASVRKKREDTARGIEEATKLREEMRKKFEDYDARMRNIEETTKRMVQDAKDEADLERSKMVSDATALGNRIREDAKLIADQEIARAKRELQDEQIARAAELAEGLLRANVNKEDQARLADEFMSRVAEKPTKEGRA